MATLASRGHRFPQHTPADQQVVAASANSAPDKMRNRNSKKLQHHPLQASAPSATASKTLRPWAPLPPERVGRHQVPHHSTHRASPTQVAVSLSPASPPVRQNPPTTKTKRKNTKRRDYRPHHRSRPAAQHHPPHQPCAPARPSASPCPSAATSSPKSSPRAKSNSRHPQQCP